MASMSFGERLRRAHVLNHAVRRQAGVEQRAPDALALVTHTSAEKPCSARSASTASPLSKTARRNPGRIGVVHRGPLRGTLVLQEHVRHVIDQRRYRNRVDGFERYVQHCRRLSVVGPLSYHAARVRLAIRPFMGYKGASERLTGNRWESKQMKAARISAPKQFRDFWTWICP